MRCLNYLRTAILGQKIQKYFSRYFRYVVHVSSIYVSLQNNFISIKKLKELFKITLHLSFPLFPRALDKSSFIHLFPSLSLRSSFPSSLYTKYKIYLFFIIYQITRS